MERDIKSNGALVGLIIIIIILVAGGIYIWISNKEAVRIENSQTQSQTITDEDSAELDSLEADLNTTDTSTGVDAETVY